MRGSIGGLVVLMVLAVAPLRAQEHERDAIQITARVLTGLSTTPSSEAIDAVGEAVGTEVPGLNAGAERTTTFVPSDFDTVAETIEKATAEHPGLVVSMVLIGPDGEVERSVSGTSNSIPEWWTRQMLEASQLMKDESGYFLYIHVSACDV